MNNPYEENNKIWEHRANICLLELKAALEAVGLEVGISQSEDALHADLSNQSLRIRCETGSYYYGFRTNLNRVRIAFDCKAESWPRHSFYPERKKTLKSDEWPHKFKMAKIANDVKRTLEARIEIDKSRKESEIKKKSLINLADSEFPDRLSVFQLCQRLDNGKYRVRFDGTASLEDAKAIAEIIKRGAIEEATLRV